MTLQVIQGAAPIARHPARLDTESEFLMLMALRERTDARLDVLADALRTELGLPRTPLQRMQAEDAARAPISLPVVALPASGLTQAAPGVLLFRGGHDA